MVYSYSPDLESAGEVCGLKVASRCDVITVGHVGARGLRSHCLSETPNDKGTPKRAHSVRGHRGSPRHARSSRHEILRFALQLRTQCSLRIPPIHGSLLGTRARAGLTCAGAAASTVAGVEGGGHLQAVSILCPIPRQHAACRPHGWLSRRRYAQRTTGGVAPFHHPRHTVVSMVLN